MKLEVKKISAYEIQLPINGGYTYDGSFERKTRG